MRNIAIVGASLAGLNAAVALRNEGFRGRLVLIGEEPNAPYDRPPLSKEIIRGTWPIEQVNLSYDAQALGAEWRLGAQGVALDAQARRLRFDTGDTEEFDGIVIATGASPRRLGRKGLAGVHVIRSREDALRLRAELADRPARVVVIGGGFIGQEVASSCRLMGLAVTLIESDSPAQRVLGREIGLILADIHRRNGVDVRLGVSARGFEGEDCVTGVHLSDGTTLPASVVVVGLGVTPNIEWLQDSGLNLDDGVMCDRTCLAAPGIVAAGDVARWPNELFEECRRIEHWDNAIRQGQHAAIRLLDPSVTTAQSLAYAPVPWFWSDQYSQKLQLAGSTLGYDEIVIAHGSVESGKFVAQYRRGTRLTGVFALGCASILVKYRRALQQRINWGQEVVS
jgi:3-phenylpropionate/trans-cinnamate dioxygenase ferredoxin reductase subunit